MNDSMTKNLVIVLVEDNTESQKQMIRCLQELFPGCTIETLANGIAANNYLLAPTNQYDLVILDGKLKKLNTLIAPVDGPDVAQAMCEKGIQVPVVLFTQDPAMLTQFDEIYGKRLPEIKKPCQPDNVSQVLIPLVNSIQAAKPIEVVDSLELPRPN